MNNIIDTILEIFFFIAFIVAICLLIYFFYLMFEGNNEICLGGHYEIRNRIINGRQFPIKTFICDSAKIIYK